MKQLAKIFRRLLFAILLFALGYWVAEWLATPPRFDLSQIAFSHALREEKDMPVVEVFFVTNRAALPGGQEFSQESSEALAYGIAEVRIPENFRLADVQRPEISRQKLDSLHACILAVHPLSADAFHQALHERLKATNSARATLFVHGIQNSFDSAVRQAGTLAFGLNLQQPMVLFSWATDPGLSTSAYARCREQVPAAAKALTDFLRQDGPNDFDILAHSLGCKVVCAALVQSDKNAPPAPAVGPLANVILVAPDVGKEDFKSVFLTPGGAASRHTTVYVARNDKALVFSSILNGNSRAGTGIDPSTPVEELLDENGGDAAPVEIVDATFVNNAHTSHGYFYQNRAALADLQALLRHDLPASQRQLLRHEKAKHANYWIIPP
jgi:esterase/lipase superfamily enzyme